MRYKNHVNTVIIFLFSLILVACTNNLKNEILDNEVLDVNEPSTESTTKSIDFVSLEDRIEDFEFLYEVIVSSFPYIEINKERYSTDFEANYQVYLSAVKEVQSQQEFREAISRMLDDLHSDHAYVSIDTQNYSFEMPYDKIPNYAKPLFRDVIPEQVGYVKLPMMYGQGFIEADRERTYNYLMSIKDYDVLIIDVRKCPGGTVGYWSEFLMPLILSEPDQIELNYLLKDSFHVKEQLDANLMEIETLDLLTEKIPNLSQTLINEYEGFYTWNIEILPDPESVEFQGKLYLLIDQYTYSAADAFSLYAKQSDLFTLVGEATAGGGMDQPATFKLPNSEIEVVIPIALGINNDGSIHELTGTLPDIVVDFPFQRDNLKYDPCILKVLELEGINF